MRQPVFGGLRAENRNGLAFSHSLLTFVVDEYPTEENREHNDRKHDECTVHGQPLSFKPRVRGLYLRTAFSSLADFPTLEDNPIISQSSAADIPLKAPRIPTGPAYVDNAPHKEYDRTQPHYTKAENPAGFIPLYPHHLTTIARRLMEIF